MHVRSLLGLGVVIAVASGAAPAAAAADAPDLSGAYKCVGDAGGGKQYEGKAEISKDGDSYVVKWAITDAHYTGLGVVNDDVLAVAIRDDNNDKYTAVIAYRIEKSGKLVGRWSVVGFKGMVLTETLTPEKSGKPTPP